MKKWLEYIRRIENKPRPTDYLDLRYCEWTKSIDQDLFDEFKNSLRWEDFAHYPDLIPLRTALSNLHGVSIDSIYIGPGSDQCIKNVFDCFEEGSRVLTTDPCFPMYDVYAQQNNLAIAKVSPRPDLELYYDPDDFSKTDADLIVLAHPFSPIGAPWTETHLIFVADTNQDSIVLVDEAYIDYMDEPGNMPTLSEYRKNLVVSRSLSKTHGAAGARIGYLIAHPEIIEKVSKFRNMYEVSGPSMLYALFLLDKKKVIFDYIEKTKLSRNKICELFESKRLDTINSQGNWVHVQQTDDLLSRFAANKIAVRSGIKLPLREGLWIRLTVGPDVLHILKKVLK